MPLCVRVSAVLVLALPAVPVLAFADPADRQGEGLSFSTGEAGSTEGVPANPEAEEEGPRCRVREVIVGDFCGGGGGEMTKLDEAQSLLDQGRPAMARAQLGQALREGLEEWERPRAFAMAGEIALRLGAAARAVAWYRQAMAVSEEPADPTARLGFAVALLRSGRRRDAVREATALAAGECGEEGTGDPMTCYGARLVAGLAASTPAARSAELERARAVRLENPDYDEMFVDFHRLLPHPRVAALQVAAVRAD